MRAAIASLVLVVVTAASCNDDKPQKLGAVTPSGQNTYPRGLYLTTPPAPANGDAVNLQVDALGNLKSAGYGFTNQTASTTVTVKNGAGTLHAVCVNTLVASATIKIYDNIVGDGGVDGGAAFPIAVMTLPSTITGVDPFCQTFDVNFTLGLVVATSGATDVTESFR